MTPPSPSTSRSWPRPAPQDFAIVGSGAVQDNFWPTTGAACDLIDIAGFSVTPEKAGLAGQDPVEARSVQPVPNAGDRFQVGAFLMVDEAAPEARDRAGIVYADLDTLIFRKDQVIDALEQVGFTFVHEATYNLLGESNWGPSPPPSRRTEVQFLHFVGEGENFALLAQAMDEIGYRPELMLMETNLYDEGWVEAAGASAEGMFVRTVFWPFEEADQNPATQQYLDLLEAQGRQGRPARGPGHVGLAALRPGRPGLRPGRRPDPQLRPGGGRLGDGLDRWWAARRRPSPGPTSPRPARSSSRSRTASSARYAPDEGYDCGEESDQPYVVEIDA